MKLSLAAALLLSAASAQATLITIPLTPNNHVYNELIVPTSDFDGLTLSGQTMSLDFTFGSSFVHLFPGTSRSFAVLPMLQIQGVGFLPYAIGQSWTVGATGERNSSVFQIGGDGSFGVTSYDTNPFNFELGHAFPVFYTPGSFDIYGFHSEITLPDAPGF